MQLDWNSIQIWVVHEHLFNVGEDFVTLFISQFLQSNLDHPLTSDDRVDLDFILLFLVSQLVL